MSDPTNTSPPSNANTATAPSAAEQGTASPPPPAASTSTQPPPVPSSPSANRPNNNKPPPQEQPREQRKGFDPLLDSWYFEEVNKRFARYELYKDYQINPYTKKTLDFVTPKITERWSGLPLHKHCSRCPPPTCTITEDEKRLLESYDLVKPALDRSIAPPRQRFCEPMTEHMRIGWWDLPTSPSSKGCINIIPPCGAPNSPCCYFFPNQGPTENELYDERFRAVHKTAEFIRTAEKIRQYDAVMNANAKKQGATTTTNSNPQSLPTANNK